MFISGGKGNTKNKHPLTSSKSLRNFYLLILYKVHYVMSRIQAHIFSWDANATTIRFMVTIIQIKENVLCTCMCLQCNRIKN